MISINISNLKNQLSDILKKVKKGQDIIVLDRKHPVAKISALSFSDLHAQDSLHTDEMERRGIIVRPKSKKVSAQWLKNKMVKTSSSAVDALLKEREESRF